MLDFRHMPKSVRYDHQLRSYVIHFIKLIYCLTIMDVNKPCPSLFFCFHQLQDTYGENLLWPRLCSTCKENWYMVSMSYF